MNAIARMLSVSMLFGPLAVAGELPAPVSHVMQSLRVAESDLSIYVQRVDSDRPLLDVNADVPRSPASTIKVLTTYLALDALGPAHTWHTRAYAEGELRGGELKGDLILEGGGDPFMVDERWWNFVQGIRLAGIERVRGDLVIDNDYFSVPAADPGEFDGQRHRTYNVLPDALLVNFQSTRLHVRADASERAVRVAAEPWPVNLTIENRLRLGEGRCGGYQRGIAVDVQQGGDTVVLSGTYPAACGDYWLSRAVLTAPEFAYGTFRALWQQSGGTLDGGLRLGDVRHDAKPVFAMESLTLAEIIRLVNKFSSNVMTRHLLLTVAAERFGTPGTVENGRRAIEAWLAVNGFDFPELYIENGSGLSRRTAISARHLAEILLHAEKSPYAPEFKASLPLAGTDGTLRNRLRGHLRGRVRLKTGRLDDVSAIAGYVLARSGDTYAIVVLHNGKDAHRGLGEEIQDALVRWVFDR